jgi:SAM-dependent methyltransferase
MSSDNTDDPKPQYSDRVEHQIAQFANKEALVGLPEIHRYWNQNYVIPVLDEVFGDRNIWRIYARTFIQARERIGCDSIRILSIGCGDCKPDIQIAKALLEQGAQNFTIIATELSAIRLERAKQQVDQDGLSEYFDFKEVDVNTWSPDDTFVGVLAHHTLHHIVELERLFDFIDENLKDEGVFVVVDMIGRNGHMRWPETLDVLEKLWKILPTEYKFNHQFKKPMPDYDNWDCSKKGFEGIRAQDILALLCDKFSFTHFVGVGGFIDILAERGYGHNFSVDDEYSLAIIDLMAQMNDAMLLSRQIKPTIIYAICQKKHIKTEEKCYRNLTSRNAIRPV